MSANEHRLIEVRRFIHRRHNDVSRIVRIAEIKGPLNLSDRPRANLVVSLTSYGDRLKTCHLAIKSILDQELVPSRVVLWLDDETNGIRLPEELTGLVPLGVEIRRGCNNLRGHKKYFYAMREFGNLPIITIDDDVLYDRDVISTLVALHYKFPEAVVARRAHRIMASGSHLLPYHEWGYEFRENCPHPRASLMATGVGGVLYPPYFADDDLLNEDAIKAYALRADDIWLKAFEARKKILTVSIPTRRPHPLQIPGTMASGLSADVTAFGLENDLILSKLMDLYGLAPQAFEDEES